MSKFTVLFQGDSITDCGRATCGGAGFDNRGLGPGYPGMIAARLACDRPDVDWQFINRVAVGSVFAVVFATMLYASGKIRKDDPVEALKTENL